MKFIFEFHEIRREIFKKKLETLRKYIYYNVKKDILFNSKWHFIRNRMITYCRICGPLLLSQVKKNKYQKYVKNKSKNKNEIQSNIISDLISNDSSWISNYDSNKTANVDIGDIETNVIEKKIIKENDNTINDDIKEANLNKIMREEGQLQLKGRKGSNYFSLSQNFLQQYDAIEIPNLKLNKDNKKKLEDLSLGKNLINDEENKDIENIKNMFGNQKEETNPILLALYKRLDELQKKRKEIDSQFKNEKDLYEKRIETLNNAWNTRVDKDKLKELEKINKQNKDTIKELKLKIDEAEKDKIKDRQKFNEAMNYVLELKSRLIKELKELEIMAKITSYEDYNEYMNNDPIKIEKTNFRANDSRYLLTNEYETSRDDDESLSSYDKLNNINNTPEGFEINRQKNIYLNDNYTNTKNRKIRPSTHTNDNNIINNNTINNKITEGSFRLKQKE